MPTGHASAAPAALPLHLTAQRLAEHALHTARTLAARPADDRDRRHLVSFAGLADALFDLAERLEESQAGQTWPAVPDGRGQALQLVLAECEADDVSPAQLATTFRTARRLIGAQAARQQRAARQASESGTLDEDNPDALPTRDIDGNPIDRHDLGARFYAAHQIAKARREQALKDQPAPPNEPTASPPVPDTSLAGSASSAAPDAQNPATERVPRATGTYPTSQAGPPDDWRLPGTRPGFAEANGPIDRIDSMDSRKAPQEALCDSHFWIGQPQPTDSTSTTGNHLRWRNGRRTRWTS